MFNTRTALIYLVAIGLLAAAATDAAAQFVPPAGYGGKPNGPGVAPPTDPAAPPLKRLSDAEFDGRFHLDPNYHRTGAGHVKVVGVFEVTEPDNSHFVDAWSTGFMPTLAFSDGRCFSFTAEYNGCMLWNGRLAQASCEKKVYTGRTSLAAPADSGLRLVGFSWSFGAWVDDARGKTIVTSPASTTFETLFTADMRTSAIMAMNGPDWPGGNVTLVGRVNGRLTIVTLEVNY